MINGMKLFIDIKKIVLYLLERIYLNDWMKVLDLFKFFYDFYSDFDVRRVNEMIKSLDIDVNEKLKIMFKGIKEKV